MVTLAPEAVCARVLANTGVEAVTAMAVASAIMNKLSGKDMMVLLS